MKKLSSILLLPLIALILLCGCGPTQRTALETKTLINDKIGTYNVDTKITGTNAYNWYFGGEKDAINKHLIVTYSTDDDCLLNQTILSNTKPSEMETELYNRYVMLNEVYQRELTLIYNYYNQYFETFFSNVESKDVDSKELTSLYDKTKTLIKELESFDASKKDLEREVKLFGVNSNLVSASVDKFYYSFNKLINKSLNMVNYFRDLHVKYFFNSATEIDAANTQRLYLDGQLTFANFIYKDYLNSLTNNDVVDLKYVKTSLTYTFNIFNANFTIGKNFNKLFNKNSATEFNYTSTKEINALINKITYAKPDKPEEELTEDEKTAIIKALEAQTEAINKVKQFEINLNNFKQQFKLYNKVYDNIDMNQFNNARFGITNFNYVGISDSEKKPTYANYLNLLYKFGNYKEYYNVKLIYNMESATVSQLLNAFETLIA